MLKIIAIIIFIPCISFAQKKEKVDTLTVDLNELEQSILQDYSKEYQQRMNDINRLNMELKQVEQKWRNILRMKVESVSGDPKKYYDYKSDKDGKNKLFYMKP